MRRILPPVLFLTLGLACGIGLLRVNAQPAKAPPRAHEQQIAPFMHDLEAFGRANRRPNVPPEHGRFLRTEPQFTSVVVQIERGDGFAVSRYYGGAP